MHESPWILPPRPPPVNSTSNEPTYKAQQSFKWQCHVLYLLSFMDSNTISPQPKDRLAAYTLVYMSICLTCVIWQIMNALALVHRSRKVLHFAVLAEVLLAFIVILCSLLNPLADLSCDIVSKHVPYFSCCNLFSILAILGFHYCCQSWWMLYTEYSLVQSLYMLWSCQMVDLGWLVYQLWISCFDISLCNIGQSTFLQRWNR